MKSSMYSDNNLVFVLTILEAIEKIKIYSNDFQSAEEFLWANHQLNFNAVNNLLLTVGEESKKIDEGLKIEFPAIDWNAVSGFRNRLAHDYRGTDPDIIYGIITQHLEELKTVILEMLGKIDFDEDILQAALDSDYYQHLHYLKNN